MTGEELITKYDVRDRLSDELETGYSDQEILAYLNDAINYIWHALIQKKSYAVIGDVTFTQANADAPTDWYKSTTQAPVIIRVDTTGALKAEVYGTLPYTVRYYKKPTLLASLNDNIVPSGIVENPLILDALSQLIIILAMNNHGFDVTTEINFVLSNLKMMI